MIKAASPSARKVKDDWLGAHHPEVLWGIRALQAHFGPGEWVGYAGEGEDELRTQLLDNRNAVARAEIARAKNALS